MDHICPCGPTGSLVPDSQRFKGTLVKHKIQACCITFIFLIISGRFRQNQSKWRCHWTLEWSVANTRSSASYYSALFRRLRAVPASIQKYAHGLSRHSRSWQVRYAIADSTIGRHRRKNVRRDRRESSRTYSYQNAVRENELQWDRSGV